MSVYDLVIVGAGISGLRVGIEALKRYPGLQCCILEKYGYIGGRVVTYHTHIPKVGEVAWENGAGRISTSHKKVLELLKRYKLTFVPIGEEIDWIDRNGDITKNKFNDLINFYFGPIEALPNKTLATNTLKELLDSTVGPHKAKEFYEQFPYWSEIHTLRADIALESFRKEMGTYEGFGVCKEGLSKLIEGMSMEFVQRGGKILMDTELVRVINNPDDSVFLHCKVRNTDRHMLYTGKAAVLALHRDAISKINCFKNLPVLKRLEMTPLLRMYAVFPTKGGVSWFSGLNKIVTKSPVRYILPIDAKRGIVMISYTDGNDAKVWIREGERKHGEENVKDLVMSEIRALFPDRTIPDPIFFKLHPWSSGCTYWLPGNYIIEDESNKSLHPMPYDYPGLFMCGESFAVHQCWMESALDQADNLLNQYQFRTLLIRKTY
jgi:monoamine oxidase